MLPSIEPHHSNGRRVKPKVYVLAVRHPKKPEKGVLARLLVEHIEQVVRYADGGIRDVSFEIAYRVIGARPDDIFSRGNFVGGYSTFDNRVSITSTQVWSDGGVLMDVASTVLFLTKNSHFECLKCMYRLLLTKPIR